METKLFEDRAYIKLDTELVTGWHNCSPNELLANYEPYKGELDGELLKWRGAKLPTEMLAKFLSLASHYPKTEVKACLYYSVKDRKWLCHIPKQKGTPVEVTYNDEDFSPPQGYFFTGTIHTHPDLGAFWSGTDMKDQVGKDGLHFVLGLKSGKLDTLLASVFCHGKVYDQKAEDVLEGLPDLDNLPETDPEWLKLVEAVYEPEKDLKQVFKFKEIRTSDAADVDLNGALENRYPLKDSFLESFALSVADNLGKSSKSNLEYAIREAIIDSLDREELYNLAEDILDRLGEYQIVDEIEELRYYDSDSYLEEDDCLEQGYEAPMKGKEDDPE